jgi:hypothetical protein
MKFEISTYFSEKNIIKCQNIMKIRAVGAQLLNVGGRTDRQDKSNIRFSKFCESA